MKPSNAGSLIRKRELKLILVFSLLILIVSLYRPLRFLSEDLAKAAYNGYKLSNFDMMTSFEGSGNIDFNSYMFFIFPVFITLIIYIVNTNTHVLTTIRYKCRNRLWNKNIVLVLLSAFVISIMLVFGGYLISGLIVGGFNNVWNTQAGMPFYIYGTTKVWPALSQILVTRKVLSFLWITTFLGLVFVGTLICFCKLFIKDIYIYALIIGICFADNFGVFGVKLILGIALNPGSWINPITIIITNMYFILGFLVMYWIGKSISSKKDQCIEKR